MPYTVHSTDAQRAIVSIHTVAGVALHSPTADGVDSGGEFDADMSHSLHLLPPSELQVECRVAGYAVSL